MKKKWITTAGLVCCFLICLAAVADLSGTWKCTIRAPDGNDYPVTYIFNIKGDTLTGSVQAGEDPKAITDGKIKGTEFSFNVTGDDGSPIPHTGKYYSDGDSIAITLEYEGNKIHASLRRADK